jgi:MOSC domain-containing protein YiiM
MRVSQINIGTPKEILFSGRTVQTSIVKTRVEGPVRIADMSIGANQQADTIRHGGEDKAVYAMSLDCYDWWRTQGGHDVALGTLGENLSVEGLSESEIGIGDIFSFGEARLEVAQPRFPCGKLNGVLGDLAAGKKMILSGMPGIYFRVLKEGLVEAGQELVCEKREPTRLTVLELFTAFLKKDLDAKKAKAALEIKSLMPSWRDFLESEAMLGD